jgi:hypothetical protein
MNVFEDWKWNADGVTGEFVGRRKMELREGATIGTFKDLEAACGIGAHLEILAHSMPPG